MGIDHKISPDMRHPIPHGFLVAIEGIDGAGKTTVVDLLAAYCTEHQLSHTVSKEPTTGPYGQQIRNSAIRGRLTIDEEVELLRKDRQEHVDNLIRPALEEEQIVILDRYYFSTAAYQGAHGADAESILKSNEEFAPQPDLLILLDVSHETGIQRIINRGDQPNKFETAESLEKARHIFLDLDRPYKLTINAEESKDVVGERAVRRFQRVAMDKISRHDLSVNGVNRTREFFGGEPIPVR